MSDLNTRPCQYIQYTPKMKKIITAIAILFCNLCCVIRIVKSLCHLVETLPYLSIAIAYNQACCVFDQKKNEKGKLVTCFCVVKVSSKSIQ